MMVVIWCLIQKHAGQLHSAHNVAYFVYRLHVICCGSRLFLFKQKTSYDIEYGLVGSEMCIGDRVLSARL